MRFPLLLCWDERLMASSSSLLCNKVFPTVSKNYSPWKDENLDCRDIGLKQKYGVVNCSFFSF